MSTFKFPFKGQDGKEVRNADVYYDALTMASSGYYPLGPSGVHCGIHYEPSMANTLALGEGVRAIAKGEVVAYRVNRSYLSVQGRAQAPMSDNALYSSGFVLTRHTLEYPAGNKLIYFCLSMHLRSFEEYERLGAKTQRPPYWTAKIYRVSQKASDRQEVTRGSAAPVIQGLRVRVQPATGTTPIQGILPPGSRIIGGEIQKGWVRIQSVIEGQVAPPKTGNAAIQADAINGWAHLSMLDAQAQVPDAFDEVVVLKTPIKVKAGTLIGHMGEYRRVVDPSSSRQLLHHEILVGTDLPAYLKKSRAAAQAAKLEEKTVLRIGPGSQLRNAVLAAAQPGVLRTGAMLELDGTPPDDAVYVKVKPVAELQWIERTAKLPTGAQEVKLYRHANTSPYAVTDLVAEANRGTAGQRKATVYRGIRVATPNAAPVWIAATAFRSLYNLKKERLVLSDLAGWSSYPLTFAANGYKNGNVPHHFAISALELARPATPDPTSEPIGYALDEEGKRWWQVQVRDSAARATGWAGEAGHTGISLHSPHEWVDFSIIESESQTPAYGSYFLALADMVAFQRGEMPLKKNQLDAPLHQVFSILDIHPDGKLTLGELQAAQRSRSTVQQLSRIILRYPSEWKANPDAWKQFDAQVSPSDVPAWESEKQRMKELAWWGKVSGQVTNFPAAPSIYHAHPVAFVANLNHPDLEELRYLSMTIYGEARGQNYQSKVAVAWIIRNRLNSGRWGDTYQSVVTARLQFTCWAKDVDPQGYEAIHNPVGDSWKESKRAAMEVMFASDSSNVLPGAINYYSPTAQASLHKSKPQFYPSTPPFAIPEKRVPNPSGVRDEDYQFYKP
ncbi:cell wall hydrolase [Salmonella enterica subsp. enterica serovar Eastbourne]|nr:cell wall hydrolase [Salmonella enterica subsp. enterica serovar Eastbourne]EHC5910527.1 cell wall hydrolase [Salmonella enterica subsp. enterica serovar Eastbourne]